MSVQSTSLPDDDWFKKKKNRTAETEVHWPMGDYGQ